MSRTEWETAGRALREHVGVDEDPASHALERNRLVLAATTRKPRGLPLLAGAVAAAAVICLVAVLMLRAGSAPAGASIAFNVGPDARAGEVGAYYTAAADTDLGLRFSDGSAVTVRPHGGVRVQRAEASKIALFVETGRARFDVMHRPSSEWRILAGPYSVNVTGTSFEVSWEPPSGKFELVMHSGSVMVRGPGIESGVVVSNRQRFVTRVTANVDQPEAATASPQSAAAGALAEDPASGSGATPAGDQARPSEPESEAAGSKAAASDSWTKLAAKGEYRRIVQAAEQQGIDASLASASADELRALADAARFIGRFALANRALLTIRSRFPGTKSATGAAFVIGRMLDASDPRTAVSWYDRYLAEGGPLAPEAAGRRMLALRRMGDAPGSRKAASEYIRRFPKGPYARQARDLESH